MNKIEHHDLDTYENAFYSTQSIATNELNDFV